MYTYICYIYIYIHIVYICIYICIPSLLSAHTLANRDGRGGAYCPRQSCPLSSLYRTICINVLGSAGAQRPWAQATFGAHGRGAGQKRVFRIPRPMVVF